MPEVLRGATDKAHVCTAQRDDVAYTLALLADRPDADGLGIDMNGGDEKIDEALSNFIETGESDFHIC